MENRGLELVYQDTLMLAAHSKGQPALMYPDTPMLASHFRHVNSLFCLLFFFFFFFSGLIFVRLSGGLSNLFFLQILYAQKELDA